MSKEQDINTLLDQVNPLIFGEGSKLRLRYVRFDEVKEQDINANVMPPGMFNQLKANVSRHKALESIPLMATREETPQLVEVVSGHHRTRAARQAGVEGGVVLLYEGLTNSEIRAKQLAHNSISGTSDPAIVKEIFSQIEGLDTKLEAYVDPEAFKNLPTSITFEEVDIDPLADAKTATVVFLPTQATDFQTALDLLSSEPDVVYLEERPAFEAFRQAVHKIKDELEILSYPTVFSTMARLAIERLAQLKQEHERKQEEAISAGETPSKLTVSAELDPDISLAFGR